ncbi:diaminopimelate decarboxylase [Streptomyces sp. TLI_171]|uniref:diaminopimelate decarboxylase n=1 Tax=Streptomyces sp. TLI_171 TaxID=1938859 RepID=UPI000C17598C|nr:diaminopimelate decarboxylase [Streptomyces sp. TLI_171]RKE05196.1 diaminopimelate decarboxylase [Streptomyces sp. TLI_171]
MTLPGAAPRAADRTRRRDLAVRAAVRAGLLDPDDTPLAAFLDLRGIAESAAALHAAWPAGENVEHTFAAKANSLVPVLRLLRGLGLGCEVASPGELAQALAAGFGPGQLVLDSPAKTRPELRAALAAGVAVNIDNFQELRRVDALVAGSGTASRIGLRINPQVGIGAIAAMSTAGHESKFGIALGDPGNRERIVDAFLARPWLRWLHVHVGSQGCPLELSAAGVAAVVALAEEIDRRAGAARVDGIDVGGGLPVNFADDRDDPTFADQVAALRSGAPGLFGGRYRLVTELGRALLAKNGFLATRVEYTKRSGGRAIALTHAGVQVAARTVFLPDAWPLRVLPYDPDGLPRPPAGGADGTVPQDVAGPCCFAGDLVARARELPLLAPGDLVVLPDTGAYYFSTPFHYNSLPQPAVHAYEVDDGGEVRFSLLHRQETVEDVVARTLGELPGGAPVTADGAWR